MNKYYFAFLALLFISCSSKSENGGTVSSPDESLVVDFGINKKDQAYYVVQKNQEIAIDLSFIKNKEGYLITDERLHCLKRQV